MALRGLSPRELSQNVGLPQREAELLRQRDFDELFFFAGASEEDIRRFKNAASEKKAQVRARGVLWSLAIGANLAACIRDLTQLYQRSMRAIPLKIGVATAEEADELFPACDRCVLLAGRDTLAPKAAAKCTSLPLFSPDTWELALEAILHRRV